MYPIPISFSSGWACRTRLGSDPSIRNTLVLRVFTVMLIQIYSLLWSVRVVRTDRRNYQRYHTARCLTKRIRKVLIVHVGDDRMYL